MQYFYIGLHFNLDILYTNNFFF